MPNLTENTENLRTKASLISEELSEVVSQVPSVLIRWGITVLCLIFMFLLLGSYLIEYPDLVKSSFHLTSYNAPKPVVARIDAKLTDILAKEGQVIHEGEVIAHLESIADPTQVKLLSLWLDTLSTHLSEKSLTEVGVLNKPHLGHLGELQVKYLDFDQAFTEFLSFRPGGFYQSKRRLLEKDVDNLILLRKRLENQKVLYKRDLELAKTEFEIQKSLFQKKVISASEFKREESKLVAKEMPLQGMEANILENLSAQNVKRKELLELNRLFTEQGNIFKQELHLLQSAIKDWNHLYLLVSPMQGYLHFNTFLQVNQNIQVGQEIFFVSAKSNKEFGEIIIPQHNLGKIRVKQDVLIRFHSYPFQEYGIVKGKVEFISEVPTKEGSYVAKVGLPNGLQTTHGIKLTYRSGMTATADVVTEDNRLIEKVFYSLKEVISR